MNQPPQAERLQRFKAELNHFHHSPDFGDGADKEVIEQLLRVRIREAETALHLTFQSTKAGSDVAVI